MKEIERKAAYVSLPFLYCKCSSYSFYTMTDPVYNMKNYLSNLYGKGQCRPIGAGIKTLFIIIASSFSPTEGLTLLIDFVT